MSSGSPPGKNNRSHFIKHRISGPGRWMEGKWQIQERWQISFLLQILDRNSKSLCCCPGSRANNVNLLTQLGTLLTSFSQGILWNSYDQDQVLAGANWETYINETPKPKVDRGERNLCLWMALMTLPPPHFGCLAKQSHQDSSVEKHLSLTPVMLVYKVPPPPDAPFF